MLRSIELFHVAVPLKKPIRHASHERSISDNLVVRATLDDGTVGYGEGVPRPYVTGETIDTTFAALSRFDSARAFGRPADFSAALRALATLSLPEIEADPRGMAGNAARCALELALLDSSGRLFDRSLASAIPEMGALLRCRPGLIRSHPMSIRYSGAITAEEPRKERRSAWKMRLYGFPQVKVKVGVQGQDDPSRLATLRRILGNNMDIRLDANEAWDAASLPTKVAPLRRFHPSALEQPVPHAEVEALTELRPSLGIPIMLDESLCGLPDAEAAIAGETADLFNVRLSKCGGLVPSLRLLDRALSAGLGAQLGCHPGETGLLSAAGRHVATSVEELRYIEGSYDRHVLANNLIAEDITFGYGGRARPLSGPGLGVTVVPEALERLTVRRLEVRYD